MYFTTYNDDDAVYQINRVMAVGGECYGGVAVTNAMHPALTEGDGNSYTLDYLVYDSESGQWKEKYKSYS